MRFRTSPSFLAFLLFLATFIHPLHAQHAPNANAIYQQLRGLLPGGDVITINNYQLHRDAATFTFRSGSIAFYGQVNGKITGAVFKGDGHLHLTPPNAEERHNLSIFTHAEEFDEDFDQVVLRFTDATADELRKAAAGKGEPDGALTKAGQNLQEFARHQLHTNLDLRLLEDVLSPAPGGYLFAAVHGKKNPHLLFTVDPHGAPEVDPEEVSLVAWNDWGETYLTAFSVGSGGTVGEAIPQHGNEAFRIENEDLDTTIEKGGFLTGLATVHIVALEDGVAVAPLLLFPTLRVSNVETDKGDALDFVQEKKDDDPDFGVVLGAPLKKGERATLKIAYGGKEVVRNEGNSNYYPIARESWYPNAAHGLGDYATYHMVFHVPKGLQLIATGTKVRESTEGKMTTSDWKTDVPLPVVGFNLGDFTMKEAVVKGKMGEDLAVDAYANINAPDIFNVIAEAVNSAPLGTSDDAPSGAIGSINTADMLPVQLSQGEAAAQIYTHYFGPLPFAKVALTQQFACSYGQSWPMLVYLPICGFLDQTQQHVLGLHPEDMYWKMVTAHEVAHQWWGQTVGFRSYRDQWMSEGFADESASIFLLLTRPKPNDYLDFWKEQRKLITEKNAMGFRPIDVGPVTMGFRLSTQKTGWNIYQDLVYPKGAFILHMVQRMMWNSKNGDANFSAMMQDFVNTYRLQSATTEDFKAMVEKHMTPAMDLGRDGKMDWFFNQYVYGTELPAYHFEGQITPNGDGNSMHFKLTQSGVSANFRMAVPFYVEYTDGKVIYLGSVVIVGDKTIEQTVALPKLPAPVKRLLINYNYDVLSTEN